jgi:hypothetical protein
VGPRAGPDDMGVLLPGNEPWPSSPTELSRFSCTVGVMLEVVHIVITLFYRVRRAI